MQKIILTTLACTLVNAAMRVPAEEPKKADANKAKLPKVLLIGDSISSGYSKEVQNQLRDKAEVVQAGCGYTTPALEKLDEWLALADWDVIHFNFGLNDFEGAPPRVSTVQYERNLREIVRKLKGAKCELIWCSTTPITPGKLSSVRDYRDVPRYNEVACKVMKDNKISVNDLYSFTLPRLKELQIEEDVHFKPDGYVVLAKQVASAIDRHLPK